MEVKLLSAEERQQKYQKSDFVATLLEQNFTTLSRQKTKFTDELFPPEETSVFADHTKIANEKDIPSFIKVSVI